MSEFEAVDVNSATPIVNQSSDSSLTSQSHKDAPAMHFLSVEPEMEEFKLASQTGTVPT